MRVMISNLTNQLKYHPDLAREIKKLYPEIKFRRAIPKNNYRKLISKLWHRFDHRRWSGLNVFSDEVIGKIRPKNRAEATKLIEAIRAENKRILGSSYNELEEARYETLELDRWQQWMKSRKKRQ